MRKLIFGAILLTAFAVKATAQTATAEAKAEISSQLSISLTPGSSLNFGKIAVSAGSPGYCNISTVGTVQVTGGVNTIPSTTSNAVFDLTGVAGSAYSITLPASTTVTINDGSGVTMTVDNFKARPLSKGSDELTGTLNSSTGTDKFTVGGQLNVIANQKNGIYLGTFVVSVAYN